jgi:methionine aminopeptidase
VASAAGQQSRLERLVSAGFACAAAAKQNETSQQFLSVADESVVLERGDLIHVDFGLNYMGLSTDWQKHAYILQKGERDAPAV